MLITNNELMDFLKGNISDVEKVLDYEKVTIIEGDDGETVDERTEIKRIKSIMYKYLNGVYSQDSDFIPLISYIITKGRKLQNFRLSPYFKDDIEDIISAGYVAYLDAEDYDGDDDYYVYKKVANACRRYLYNKYKNMDESEQAVVEWTKHDSTDWDEVNFWLNLELTDEISDDAKRCIIHKLKAGVYPKSIGGRQLKKFKDEIKKALL